jgi:hypothetical protein
MNVKTKTILSILIPVGILLIMVVVYYLRQSGSDMKHARTDFKFTSRELNIEFIKNDSLANAKFGNKVVELTGVVANIRKSEMHGIILTYDDAMMGIKCVLDTTIKTIPQEIKEGSTATLKGICAGSDQMIGVMLHKCIIMNHKPANP